MRRSFSLAIVAIALIVGGMTASFASDSEGIASGVTASPGSGAGCALFTPTNLPRTELVAEEIACAMENAFVDEATLNAICKFLTPGKQAAGKVVAETHRAMVAKRMAALRAECMAGGADAGKK